MAKMSPNQSGTTAPDDPTKDCDRVPLNSSVIVNGQEGGCGTGDSDHGIGVVDDPHLTTDCPSYSDVMHKPLKRVEIDKEKIFIAPPQPPKAGVEIDANSDASTPSQKITIESIKGHSDGEEDDFEDDRSSVVTESSMSEYGDHIEGNERLRRTADTLAVDAINCASDELQCNNNNGVICVNSELGPIPHVSKSGPLGLNGGVGVNKGYLMSEVGKPSRSRDDKRNGKELVLSEANGHMIPISTTATTTSPSGQQTTAIFNESTDITLGNKTFITGSLTIKQYIKDANPTPPRQSFWKKLSTRRKVGLVVGIAVMALALITLLVLLNVLPNGQSSARLGDGDDDRKNIPIESTIGADQTSNGTIFRMVSRDQWIAQPPNNVLDKLVLPVNRVIIQHTATENCTTQSACVFRVRYIQNFHMESENFDDIGYNFMIGGDGAVYEGRGWDSQGAHTKGYNRGSLGIAFIGTFTKYAPPARQLNVAKLLLEEGVRLKKLTPDYKLYGHRQFYGTESPGEKLYQILTTWKHWANDVV